MAHYAFVEGEDSGDSFDLVDGSVPSGAYNNHYNAIMIYHNLYHLESYNNNPDMTVITFFLPSKFTL